MARIGVVIGVCQSGLGSRSDWLPRFQTGRANESFRVISCVAPAMAPPARNDCCPAIMSTTSKPGQAAGSDSPEDVSPVRINYRPVISAGGRGSAGSPRRGLSVGCWAGPAGGSSGPNKLPPGNFDREFEAAPEARFGVAAWSVALTNGSRLNLKEITAR